MKSVHLIDIFPNKSILISEYKNIKKISKTIEVKLNFEVNKI